MTDFLGRTEQLFTPIDAWGEFRRGARPAAVTFILYDADGHWRVPFVRRRADLPDHPGQVALPGGGVRAGESAWEAAQREVAEEIGVPVGRLRPLGAGRPIYAAVSNFSVVPFVKRRGDLRDHPGQVALPGGGVHAGESAWEAAQREVTEEIGVPAGRLEPVGAGDPIYTAVSNF